MAKVLSNEEKQINKVLREYGKLPDHTCGICGKQVYSYEEFYTVTTHRKTSSIFHAACMGREVCKNAAKRN